MNILARRLLLELFGRPRGVLGRVGGAIMARTNRECAAWVAGLLDIQSDAKVLEVGFGPGIGIEFLSRIAAAGYVAGVDPSTEMLNQARARNAEAIAGGRVDLQLAAAENLPFSGGIFDAAMAVNSLQVWPDAIAGLCELWRVLRPGGRIALGFTPYSGQHKVGLGDMLTTAGFSNVRLVEHERDFCELAAKP